ncbi:hypothetical protein BCR34DRAFT_388959 [Clohesyomyces aquaticus]|uniref:Uncharacterized protein n=1 Tax=Clohesyomyces aquaticus TaxID=1231657 RepID=A0A1Y1ZEU9_9PLEO|nr:hypothetical protein BCR34DRAFT_388959 [Clohesyomyces aquaticus]
MTGTPTLLSPFVVAVDPGKSSMEQVSFSDPAAIASPLLRLPAELRNRVYDFYFCHDPTTPTPPVSRSPLALSLTCRQFCRETHSLAFSSATFPISQWRERDISAKLSRVRPAYRFSIKRLEITVGIYDFLGHPHSLHGIKLSDAGLRGIEDLHITFTGEPQSEEREVYILSNLENLLWATVAKCNNERLSKVRIVHSGTFRWYTINELCVHMGRRLPLRGPSHGNWETLSDPDQGRFRLVKRDDGGAEIRNVLVLMGQTGREAERYQAIKEDLLHYHRASRILEQPSRQLNFYRALYEFRLTSV